MTSTDETFVRLCADISALLQSFSSKSVFGCSINTYVNLLHSIYFKNYENTLVMWVIMFRRLASVNPSLELNKFGYTIELFKIYNSSYTREFCCYRF